MIQEKSATEGGANRLIRPLKVDQKSLVITIIVHSDLAQEALSDARKEVRIIHVVAVIIANQTEI
jgi:hypothetical protein